MSFSRLESVLLVAVVFGAFLNASWSSKNVPCSPVGYCKCEFPSGIGVDLTPLRGPDFNISFSRGQLWFYPCKDFNVSNSTTHNTTLNECEFGVSLCMQQTEGNYTKFLSLGNLSESHFDWPYISLTPSLIFKHLNRTATIKLTCTKDSPGTLDLLSQLDFDYMLELRSINACDTTVTEEGHSVFSTVIIMCLLLFFFYLFGGFLVLRFIRGARGWEAIPNGEFWKSAWLSFKKMCIYLVNGCHHPEAYDTI